MAEGGANGWEVGSKSKDGGYFPTGALFSSTTYYITCSNSAGSDNDSVTVNVGQQGNAPTVDLSADDTSINDGESTTLRWTTGNNPTSCTASGDWSGSKSISGSSQSTGSLTSTKTYNISCSNSFGSNNDSVTVSVNDINRDQPDVTTRSATDIEENEATLRGEVDGNGLSTRVWFEWGEDRDDVEDGDGEETDEMSTGSGTDSFDEDIDGLDEDTIYYFRAVARNSEGTDYGSVLSFRTDEDGGNDGDVNVDLRADRTRLGYGDSTTLRWDSDNADSCRALRGTGGWSGSKNRSGSFNTGALYNTTTYEISCEDNNDEDSDSVTIVVENQIVEPIPQQPTVVIYADSTNLAYNGATSVRWNTVNATSCTASGGSIGWAGTKSIGPGSFYTGSLSSTRTYTITCYNNVGSSTDSATVNVRGQVLGTTTPKPTPTSLVLVTSSVDRTKPIVPTLDNTKPCPGDEINYTITYQNIGTGSVTNLVLRLDLPYEVSYMFSNPNNPFVSGNTLIFNLGTLRANGQGTVTVHVRVRDDARSGTNLNFPAVLSYVDPSGFPQSVTANVVAQVWCEPLLEEEKVALTANVFGAGFLPTNLFGWLLLLILILILVLLARYLFSGQQPFSKKIVTTTIQH